MAETDDYVDDPSVLYPDRTKFWLAAVLPPIKSIGNQVLKNAQRGLTASVKQSLTGK